MSFGRVKTFDAWKKDKSTSNYRKSKSGTVTVKKKVDDCTMNIGLMTFDAKAMILKAKWGKRLPIKTKTNATYKELLRQALEKWKLFNKQMIEEDEGYLLL